MIAAVATENKAKLKAVKEVFSQVWNDVQIKAQKTASGVSDQPISEEEGIRGALNRAENIKKLFPQADFYVGMEGYVDRNEFGCFLAGAVAIIDKDNKIGIGLSAKMQLPDKIAQKLDSSSELSQLMYEMLDLDKEKIKHLSGSNGILSQGLYNRVDEFKDAAKCALTRFISTDLYN